MRALVPSHRRKADTRRLPHFGAGDAKLKFVHSESIVGSYPHQLWGRDARLPARRSKQDPINGYLVGSPLHEG